MLTAPVMNGEIVEALKGIGDLKAPGIDGFNAKFFKSAWSVVGEDTIRAVQEFFVLEQMYMAVNCSVVTLIPKIADATEVKDFRPISCCTTLYKIISKVLTNRLSKVIGEVVHESQAAFIPGQQIHNHILLAYELLRGYSRKGGTPRCMLRMDLQKAYDTVEWSALEGIL